MTRYAHRRTVLEMGGSSLGVLLGGTIIGELGKGSDPDAETAGDFVHETIDSDPPTTRLGYCDTADLTGNGREDVIVGGKGPRTNLWLFGSRTSLPTVDRVQWDAGLGDATVFWYENPGWERHDIAHVPHVSEGGATGDVTGNGRADIILGQGLRYTDLYWFEQPDDSRDPWPHYLITDEFEMYHDVSFGDVDGDGHSEVVVLSQRGKRLFYYDIPADPRQEPWPEANRTTVMTGTNTKGIALTRQLGGPGALVAGNSVYHDTGTDRWKRERFTTGYEQPRIAVADLDGDGENELVVAEGDSPALGTHPGRLAWFDPPDWTENVLRDDLFCPHSLAVVDLDGNGAPDIFVGEMGLDANPDPKLLVFWNDGNGEFREQVISDNVPTHQATVADLTGKGNPDIVGKSYRPQNHIDVWFNPN